MQSLFIPETKPDNVVNYILGSSTLTIAAGLPNGDFGPYSPTQDGNSALRSPFNAPRGIAVDSLASFPSPTPATSTVRKLNSNVIFPATPVGSQSATMPLTFAINQNINLSATSGADFTITSHTCSGALSPHWQAQYPTPARSSSADLTPITAAAVFPVELTGLGVFFASLRRRKKLGTQKMRLLAVILFSLVFWA